MAVDNSLLAQLEHDITNDRLVLPTLPEVAVRVRQILQGDWSVPQLTEAIETDPGLAARLIKVANSPMYRPSRQVEDITSAIARLGRKLIESLVNQLALLQSMQCYSAALSAEIKTVNEHGLEVGAICRSIAKRYKCLNPDHAMLAGLVHDIGKLPLLQRLSSLGHAIDHEGRQAIAKFHPRVGALIMETWQFSPEVVIAVREHGKVMRDSAALDYADLVIIGNLTYYRSRGIPPYSKVDPASIPAVNKFDADPEELLQTDQEELQEALQGFVA